MATATTLQLSSPPSFNFNNGMNQEAGNQEELIDYVARLAAQCRSSLNELNVKLPDFDPSHPYTADEILALPLDVHRIPDDLYNLPRRKSAKHIQAEMLCLLLDPSHEGSLTSIIRYEADRVRLRAWAALQRKYDRLVATKRNGHTTMGMTSGVPPGVSNPVWASRITAQGPWDPKKTPVSLDGCPAVPMPVHVAKEEELTPFFDHLQVGGTHDISSNSNGIELDGGQGEPYYGTQGAEFQKGVLYEDGRMDLCKMVVGPDHIWRLMQSLRTNTFVRHFLLGNNIIGPSGAAAVAKFIREFPNRMETWYLAGNCINGESFTGLVDALVTSPAVRHVWLKRNPLGSGAAHDLFRLITQTENLCTLDLDQTELGDKGAAELFSQLAAYKAPDGSHKLPLRNLYLNGNGISTKAAIELAKFLASPHCGLESLYLSCNPLGNEGAQALACALPNAPYLTRLLLQSVGVSTQGVIALCEGLIGHPGIRALDLGQAFATQDLGQAYNFIEEAALPALVKMLESTEHLEYLNLAHCPIDPAKLRTLTPSILKTKSLLYYNVISMLPDPEKVGATFIPARDNTLQDYGQRTKTQVKADKDVRAHLEENVQAKYGEGVSYVHFMEEEKRWLVNDKEVRKIDSVYRNRDAGMARRGLMTLVKDWEEEDDTLKQVMNAQGPVCTLRRHR